MKLTQEQIEEIKSYLNWKDLRYVDLNYEVLDHMILQTEDKIENTQVTFNEAFDQVMLEWDKHLTLTSSWMFGVINMAPKLVINKAKKIFFRHFMFQIFLILIFMLLSLNLDIKVSTFIEYGIKGLSLLILLAAIVKYKQMKTSSELTIYSFLLKTQMVNFIIWPLAIFSISNDLFILLSVFIYALTLLYIVMMFSNNHKKIVALK